MTETVAILDPIAPQTAERLRALLPPGLVLTHATDRGDDHLKELVRDAEYVISGQVAVSGDVLRAGRRLKLLHKWGVGVDNLDLDAARELGIPVARTTGSNAVPVAEFAIGLMMAAMRNLASGHAGLQAGVWRGLGGAGDSYTLSGKTVGIVGFGAIGQALARLLSGFRCRILYSKRTPLPAVDAAILGAEHASIGELLAQSDVVSLHCPLTPETAGLIDARALRRMKRTAVLVNVARGGVVVESDLVTALRDGTIHAAAMDVYETEPLLPDSPLIGVPNLVLTPHIAALAADNFEKTVNHMFGNVARVARGEGVPTHDRVA